MSMTYLDGEKKTKTFTKCSQKSKFKGDE